MRSHRRPLCEIVSIVASMGKLQRRTGKVQIANTKLCAGHVYREIYFGTPGEVLDVTVTAMLWSAGNGPGSFLANLLLQFGFRTTRVDVDRLRRLSNDAIHMCAFGDELALSAIPLGQDLRRGSTSKNARMDQAGESYAWDVT